MIKYFINYERGSDLLLHIKILQLCNGHSCKGAEQLQKQMNRGSSNW
jgi:hypothetical protein